MFRRALIAVYVLVIVIATRVLYQVVIVEKDGPVIWAVSSTHGLHEGDLPAIGICIPLILLMLFGILRELRALRRGRKKPA